MDHAAARKHAQLVLHHLTVAEGIRQAGADPAGEMDEARRHLVACANSFGMFCDPIGFDAATQSAPADALRLRRVE